MHTFYFPRSDVRQALRTYQRSKEQFVGGRPDVRQADANFQHAYEHLIEVLNDEKLRGAVERHLSIEYPADLQIEAESKFLTFERQVVASLTGISGNASEAIILRGLGEFNQGVRISSVEALIHTIAESHSAICTETRASRLLDRKEKKKRKRQILASATYIAAGVSAIIGNIFVISGTPYLVPSIGAGAGAVVKGSVDLIPVI